MMIKVKYDKKFFHSVSILAGTIIGVGMFGIPFVFAKAGFITGNIFLFAIWILVTILALAYGEVVLRTNSKHQLVGYANLYFGKFAKRIALLALLFGIYGAMLAYLIIVGDFLSNVLGSIWYISPFSYSISFFIIASLAIFKGLRTIEWFEFSMTVLLLVIVAAVFFIGFPKIELQNLSSFFQKDFWFLPYGVILFAFGGLSAIPIQREVFLGVDGRQNDQLKSGRKFSSAIKMGTLIPLVVYFLFAFIVVGISGEATTPETVAGLFEPLGFKIVWLLSLFGILAISTTFLSLGLALKEVFRYDFGFSYFSSWFLTIIFPLILFILGSNDFIKVIGVAGAVGGGIEGIIVLRLWQKSKIKGNRDPEYSFNLPRWVSGVVTICLALGIVFALFVRI